MNWRKLVLIVVILIGVGAGGSLIYIYLAFHGGLSGVISEMIPEPDWSSSGIITARDKKKDQINIIFNAIENRADLNYAGSFTFDSCVKGDHSWKRSDPFAYKCGLRVTHFYSFNNNFREKLVTLDTILTNDGWEAEWRPMSYMLKAYYDNLKNSNYGRTRLVSSLPEMSYVEKNSWVHLNIDYAQNDSPESELEMMQYSIEGHPYNQVYSQSSSDRLKDVFDKQMAENKYFLMISVSHDYFSN